MANNNPRRKKNNPRSKNGNLRRKHRARLKAQGRPCGICNGRLGEIHYDEPSDWKHPLSFVVDEIIPVSRWKEFGYDSPEAVAQDWNNLQPAHWCCNQAKSNKVITNQCSCIITKTAGVGAISRNAIGLQKVEPKTVLTKKEQVIAKINIPDGSW